MEYAMVRRKIKPPREDCGFYDKKRKCCKALNAVYCRVEKCNFFKTEEQIKEDMIKYPYNPPKEDDSED